MKEIKKEKAKKFALTFSFLVLLFLLTTWIGYIVEIKFLGDAMYSYIHYLLYLLGYGSLDNVNVWFRLFFSIGSLLALTLFSSACTVTWLESRRILMLNNQISISKNEDGEFVAILRLTSKKRDVYGARVSLVVNIDNKSFSEFTELAYIPKNQFSDAAFTISLNSVVYKYFNELYKNPSLVSNLVATVTYSDMLSGTEFTVFEKFSYHNQYDFVFAKTNDKECIENEENLKQEFLDYVNRIKFDVDLSHAQILDSRKPNRESYSSLNGFNVDFNSDISYNNGDFQMLYVPIPEVTEWGTYHDMKCNLNIRLSITEGATVKVEIKKRDGSIINCDKKAELTKDNASLSIELAKYQRKTWENIKELCFTVFFENVKTDDKSARISVDECAFELPNAKERK